MSVIKKYEIVYDGPSRPMLRTPNGDLLSINKHQPENGGSHWGSYDEEERDLQKLADAYNSEIDSGLIKGRHFILAWNEDDHHEFFGVFDTMDELCVAVEKTDHEVQKRLVSSYSVYEIQGTEIIDRFDLNTIYDSIDLQK